ncbi:substrate-binding periplasmic protein [Marinomonas sp. PE14-40]|uniref:substrate-binding periplasmic protein n=1 Tax=Marinomonas sp. PE14-40 TaxID=3060621 RepID=UPI003F66E024
MELFKYFICFLFCLSGLSKAANSLENLEYITEQYAPYNYQDEQGIPQGFSIEVLNKVWEVLEVAPQKIHVFPWARGYSLGLQQDNTLLFSTTRSESREALFKWACPIIDIRIVLISRRHSKIEIESIEDAKQYKIVAIRSDIGQQLLKDKDFSETKIHLSNFLSSAILMLKHGHVDLISSEETTVFRQLIKMGEDPKNFNVVWVLEKRPLCFAFHHEVEEDLVFDFQKALNQVQNLPGFIQALKQKHQLTTQ